MRGPARETVSVDVGSLRHAETAETIDLADPVAASYELLRNHDA